MIDVKDLHFTYPGNKEETIKGINFNIEKGEIFGFLGPSGAGKSTTQKILIGILKNYFGSINIMGKEMKTQNNNYYENIGVSFEFPNFYNKLTALENLEFFRSLYSDATEDPKKLLSLVGLENDAYTVVSGFSKGMKMRLNFCRAFINKPEIVFLDEPTSGLDPVNAKNIKDLILEKKNEGKTVFLTTHNMQVAEDICDKVAFIVDGSLALIDSPRELKIKKGKKIVKIEYNEKGKIFAKDFDMNTLSENKEFIETIKNKKVETIHSLEATLEDIFIETTGRRLS